MVYMAFTENLLYITEGNDTIKNPHSFKDVTLSLGEVLFHRYFLSREGVKQFSW